MSEDERAEAGDSAECALCEGRGKVQMTEGGTWRWVDCSSCDGTGRRSRFVLRSDWQFQMDRADRAEAKLALLTREEAQGG